MADIANITRALSHLEVSLTSNALEHFAEFADGAERTLVGDMFHVSHEPSAQVFADLGERGVAQRYLVDPEETADVAAWLDGSGAELTPYGKMPRKNHSKAYVADGERAFLTTGAFTDATAERHEFVATFDGDGARAVQAVTDAQIGGNTRAMRAAAKHAASFGIVYNDARSGTTYLTDTLFDMVRNAKTRIAVSTKVMSDVRMQRLLDEAVARNVQVAFTDIRADGMHGNLVVADDSVYLGTAHMSSRSLGDMRYAYRQSREVGLVQHDAQLAQTLLTRLDDLGMQRYTPSEFARSNALFARMEAPDALADRIEKLAARGDDTTAHQARLPALERDAEAAEDDWQVLADDVLARREEDGLTFGGLPVPPPVVERPPGRWARLVDRVRPGD
ncbi:MAG: hypothetical protein JWM98_3089 [Thermoleophilia bacterium]|nr:hypothetical protein [Thermoleophilia bacterium]